VRPFESWDLNFVSVFYEFSVLIAFLLLILFMHDYSESEGLIICKCRHMTNDDSLDIDCGDCH
jgi:hypothetical protein